MHNKHLRAIFPFGIWFFFALLLAWAMYIILPFGTLSENVYAYAGLMFLYSTWFLAGYNHNSENILGIVMFVVFISIFYAEHLNPLKNLQPFFLVAYIMIGLLLGAVTKITVTSKDKQITRNKIGSLREHK